MNEFLNQTYFSNTVQLYLTALGIFIVGIICTHVFKIAVIGTFKKWTKKTETTVDDFLISGVEKSVIPLFYYGVFYLALTSLTLHPKAAKWIDIISVILVTFFAIRVIISSLKFALNSFLSKRNKGDIKAKQYNGIIAIASAFIWVFGFVFLLDNLGFNITTVITGLGIGGIAIALAAQAILGDLFSHFVIFFDKPFEIGDFIVVGDKRGNVEYIGLKTTRLRALEGEQLVFSNTDLTNSRIHNYKKMAKRRVVFKLGVIYQTPANQLAEIPGIVRKIIETQPDTAFDRGNFSSFGDFSLNFEFVYFVLSSEYAVYM
ncbi:MAG: mechanosensitive ion channel family protein, partial [Ignavibacteriaceae bacterium]|nr:mechanosensitive ion channel family protein [Ignavibacteriaceae bacterium]